MIDASRAKGFLSRWKGSKVPSPRIAEEYLEFCRNLPFLEESLFLDCLEVVRLNIERWALENSSIYLRSNRFYTKEHMDDKGLWYVGESFDASVESHTSGSSTGFHFIYRRMKSTFERLEWDNHYDMVLDEFGVVQKPNILYFFPNHYKKDGDSVVFWDGSPQPYLNSHGRSRRPSVHYANFDLYKSNPRLFFELLFRYLSQNPMDLIFTSGPQINSMCHYLRTLGFSGALAGLLSQTNERLLQDDASFLLDNRHFVSVCDHMRCWDGGASFFTCRSGNYHLMDNLSWCEELEGRLISTDYFNFASPFVRYWNGDFCRIGQNFSRCDCGRLYREFEFVENRPVSLGGVCLGGLRSRMLSLNISGIKQVKCYMDRLDVVSDRVLGEDEKSLISALEPRFNFLFQVE